MSLADCPLRLSVQQLCPQALIEAETNGLQQHAARLHSSSVSLQVQVFWT